MRQLLIILLATVALYSEGNYMSAQTYKWLTEVQQQMEKKEFNLALDSLSKLENLSKKRPYDMAFIHLTFGYIYLEMEKASFAKERFKNALALEILGTEQTLNLLQNLAALQMQDEEYTEAISNLQKWLSLSKKPASEIHLTLAMAYIRLKEIAKAVPEVQVAITQANEAKEEWYALLASLFVSLSRDNEAIETLNTMLELFGPRKESLGQLYSLYMKQESYHEALAVLELTYKSGFFKTASDFKQLALLYSYVGNPYAAGVMMQQGMTQEVVPEDKENYTLAYQYFLAAKEYARAQTNLEKAADFSQDGKLEVDLGQMLFEAERYKESAQALEKGLKKGGLHNEGNVLMVLGVAYYEAGELQKALDVFKKALAFASNRDSAESWITFLKSRL